MSRISGSVAKITAGTRILPCGAIHHSLSERRCKRDSSIALSSNVDDALGGPPAIGVSCHFKFGASCAFHFHAQFMPVFIDGFAPGFAEELAAFDTTFIPAEKHFSCSH